MGQFTMNVSMNIYNLIKPKNLAKNKQKKIIIFLCFQHLSLEVVQSGNYFPLAKKTLKDFMKIEKFLNERMQRRNFFFFFKPKERKKKSENYNEISVFQFKWAWKYITLLAIPR